MTARPSQKAPLKKKTERTQCTMKKLSYESAELEVLRFAAEDVIATSDLDEVEKDGDGNVDGTDWGADGW